MLQHKLCDYTDNEHEKQCHIKCETGAQRIEQANYNRDFHPSYSVYVKMANGHILIYLYN